MDYSIFLNKIKQGTVGDIPASLLWKYILLYLKNTTEPFYEEDFDGFDAFLNFIQEKADLEDYDLEDPAVKNFWNESVRALVELYNRAFAENVQEETIETDDGAEVVGRIPYGDGEFNTEDLKNADAGRSFTDTLTSLLKWVRPWYNIDFASYKAVRGTDIAKKAVSNDKNVDFTREFTDEETKWMRLLLPRNSRRVEVEDLNRNFWVISSVLGAVSSYLFDDNAPIAGFVKRAAEELLHLWENTLYLWEAIATASQKPITGIQTIVLPIYASSIQPYKKYDVYGPITEEELVERLKPLTQKYYNTHLCIVPYFKSNNYYKNYYESEIYNYICFYNATTEKFSVVPLSAGEELVYFQAREYRNRLYGLRETPTYYKWTYPVSSITNKVEDNLRHRYYGGIRVKPDIQVSMNKEGKLQVDSFMLTGYDAAREAITGESPFIVSYSKPENTVWTESSTAFSATKEENPADLSGIFDMYEAALENALYFGEFPSWSSLSLDKPLYSVLSENEIVGDGYLLKIGNFLPQGAVERLNDSQTNIIGLQSAPVQNGPTAYLANLTVKGAAEDVSELESWYGRGLGAGNVVAPYNCHYYVTQFDEQGNAFYAKDAINNLSNTTDLGYMSYFQVTLAFLRQNGWEVVRNFIEHTNFKQTSIAYFIAAVGIRPWHNTAANLTNGGTFQGYWTDTLLTHAYRFIPAEHSELITTEAIEVVKNGSLIGYVECLGEINRTEHSFGTVFKQDHGTTWRLPRLYPEQQVSALIAVEESSSIGVEIKYLDVSSHPELRTAFEQGDYDTIVAYIELNPSELKNESSLKTDYFENPSGTWSVFDGNVNTTSDPARVVGNMEKFDAENTLRQAVHMDFTFDFAQLGVSWSNSNTRVREWNSTTHTNLVDYTVDNTQVDNIWSQQYILTPTGYYSSW